jgi:hypothetical protein
MRLMRFLIFLKLKHQQIANQYIPLYEQVLMHSIGLKNAKKVVVLPKSNENAEVIKCLNDIGICLWCYTFVTTR